MSSRAMWRVTKYSRPPQILSIESSPQLESQSYLCLSSPVYLGDWRGDVLLFRSNLPGAIGRYASANRIHLQCIRVHDADCTCAFGILLRQMGTQAIAATELGGRDPSNDLDGNGLYIMGFRSWLLDVWLYGFGHFAIVQLCDRRAREDDGWACNDACLGCL